MAHPILMPKPGQMTEECALVAWLKHEGDPVNKGDILFEIETDKSNMDVEAFEEGVLLKRLVEEGETVPVNAVCAYVGEPGEAIPDAPSPVVKTARWPRRSRRRPRRRLSRLQPRCQPLPADRRPWRRPRRGGSVAHRRRGHLRISPRASRLAPRPGIDPRTLAGTGPEGRITERDVRAALGGRHAAARPRLPRPTVAAAAEPRRSHDWNGRRHGTHGR